MSFSIGIVGLPNVGKSTVFKALTKKQVDIANYPFCTIEPNKGVVSVPDDRLEKLAGLSKSKKTIYTTVEFLDIAGLVKGASKGEGLGNQFLSHIREVAAICHVVRAFESGGIIHVNNRINPGEDAGVINIELALADLEMVEKHLPKLKEKLKSAGGKEDKQTRKIIELLETKIMPGLSNGSAARKLKLSAEESALISYLSFLTFKPMIYLLNVDEDSVKNPARIAGLEDEIVIPVCAKIEAELADLSADEAREYLGELGLEMSGLDRTIKRAYEILNLISFLTTGPDETRAWTIERGTKAAQAAGKIHGDFERGFIAAEVINWQDLINAGSETLARAKGLIRLEGREYIVQDGDVCVFKFNV